MTNGPLPPHERPWRHPSELAAAPLEPTTRSGRMLIVSTATVGLVLVGVLTFVMTPGRSDAPVARLDSTIVAVGAAEAVTAGGSAIATTVVDVTSSVAALASTTTPAIAAAATAASAAASVPSVTASATVSPTTIAVAPLDRGAPVGMMLVTPIGEGLAVTTHAAMGLSAAAVSDDDVTPLAAALPSGSPVEVDIVATDGDLVVVSILSGATTEDRALANGDDSLDDDTTYVVVDGTTARFDAAVYPPPHLPEAAPVVDDEGRLLALCTLGPVGIELVTVSAIPTVPPMSTVEPSSTLSEPAATPSPPDSTQPTTTVGTTTTTDPATSTTTTIAAQVAPATSVAVTG